MNRRASFAALGASAALVVGCAFFLVVGIAAGVWQPRGAPASRAPAGTQTPGGIQLGARSYGEFLEDVREGAILGISQQAELVQVQAVFGSYTVTAPPDADVYGDVQEAAESGGVELPPFSSEGVAPTTVPYDEFLAQVEAGRITDVTQQGSDLHGTGFSREYLTKTPSPHTNVLGDIDAAAQRGGVDPPVYTRVPAGQ
jgi:hypothetical protein